MKFKEGSIGLNSLFGAISELSGPQRILKILDFFLGIPYKRGTLIGGCHEKEILTVDFEGVDCMTFIEYVEALRLSRNREDFFEKLKLVRYQDGVVDFKRRRHFFTDWDTLESVENMTEAIGDLPVKRALKVLNMREDGFWIEGLGVKDRVVSFIPTESINKILPKLQSVYYCGFFTSKEGLDVTHVGVILRVGEELKLRHASSTYGKVLDESFLDYIENKEGLIIYRPIFDSQK